MRIIIIDDDKYKVQNLRSYLKEEDTVSTFNNFCAGMFELVKNNESYDILFLDMNFPLNENEFPQPRMGLLVLNELQRRKINIPVVIYSSDKTNVEDYDNIIGYIVYDSSLYIQEQVDEIKVKCLKKTDFKDIRKTQ